MGTETGAAPRVAVRGTAILRVPPETARLEVTVSAAERRHAEAMARLSRRHEECRAVVAAFGDAVEEVSSGAVWVSPVLRHEEKVRVYRGDATLTVTLRDLDVVGALVQRLGEQEMVTLRGPYWGLRPDSPVHRRARQEAVREAVERARDYAAAVGARVTGLIELADTGLGRAAEQVLYGGAPMAPTGAYGGSGGAGGGAVLDLAPTEQTVTAEVEAWFAVTPADLG